MAYDVFYSTCTTMLEIRYKNIGKIKGIDYTDTVF